jgi:MFS family permease
MNAAPPMTPDAASFTGENKTYRCGTLTYTKAALFVLFAWLLWGDFCFTLMEAVVPTVLPLKLKMLNCPNWLMGVILSTIPGVLNMTICPYVSFKSDRYRSKWGRRLPFIIWTMPFLCVSLLLLGWNENICVILQKNSTFLSQYSPAAVMIGLIAVFMAMFQFFNMFVGSVFYYLFNDVVPAQFLARFIGIFKIVGAGASAIYNYFIFKYAETYMREILIGAAVLYFVGFGLMCLMVKEGEYPPIEKTDTKKSRGLSGIKSFFVESFSHKFYWMLFLIAGLNAMTMGISTFNVFFYRDMGLSLDQIGKMIAISGVATLLAMYFSAIFVDRWHPQRVMVYLSVFAVIGNLMNWTWTFVKLEGIYFFWLCLGSLLIGAFQTALAVGSGLPKDMRLFPRSRFGQFCSAQALVRSFCAIIAGFGAGIFLDVIRGYCSNPDFSYRFLFAWITFFSIIVAVIAIMSYVKWYQLGGDTHYNPPAPWCEAKFEELAIVPSVKPQYKYLNITLHLFNATMALSVLGIPVLAWWMYHKHAMVAFFWSLSLLLPLALAAWLCWKIVERNIRRDIERSVKGEPLRNGIPHHGVLIVVAVKFLLAGGLWIVQVIISINLNLESSAIVFGLANIITDFLLIGGVALMARVERGYSQKIDFEPTQLNTVANS